MFGVRYKCRGVRRGGIGAGKQGLRAFPGDCRVGAGVEGRRQLSGGKKLHASGCFCLCVVQKWEEEKGGGV